jgi:hypothetical protein
MFQVEEGTGMLQKKKTIGDHKTPVRRELRERKEDRQIDMNFDFSSDFSDVRDLTAADLEKLLRIDRNALDEACIIQPDAFYRVAKRLALAISQRDQASMRLKETEAEVDGDIRHEAAVHDEKVTDKAVEARKRIDKKVLDAQDAYHEISNEVGRLTALKEAFQQRSTMIKAMIELHITGYYSDPSRSSSDARDMVADRAKRRLQNLRDRDRRD